MKHNAHTLRRWCVVFGAAALAALIACGDDSAPTPGSGGPGASNNSTTAANGATTGANNGATSTNNATTSANNGTTSANNGTTSTNNSTTGPACVPNDVFFKERVWDGFMGSLCIGCHAPGGIGSNQSRMDIVDIVTDDDLQANMAVVGALALEDSDGASLLLRKARGELSHTGGALLTPGMPDDDALVEMVARFADPVECDDVNNGTNNGTSGTNNGSTGTTGSGCVSTDQYFEEQVWPFMGAVCGACHLPGGVGHQASRFDLREIASHDDVLANIAAVQEVALETYQGEPLLLLKIGGGLTHTGGALVPDDNAMYATLRELIDRFETPAECDEGELAEPRASFEITLDPNLLPQGALFVCADDAPPASSPARLRRISRVEWARNVGRWLSTIDRSAGFYSDRADNNPFDPNPANPYATFDAETSIDVPTLDLYLGMVSTASVGWQELFGAVQAQQFRNNRDLHCILDEVPGAECVDLWTRAYLEHAVLFRPPTDDELTPFRELMERTLSAEAEEGTARAETIAHVTSAAWLTTGALFRSELGEGPEDAHGRRRLSDHAIAESLAYGLGLRAPGAPSVRINNVGHTAPMEGYFADIAAAAAEDGPLDADTIDALVRAHAAGLDEERLDLGEDWNATRRNNRGEYWAARGVMAFFRQWLGYDAMDLAFKDTPNATSRFDNGDLTEDSIAARSWAASISGSSFQLQDPLLGQQLDDMIARIVFEDVDVLATLLTSNRMYVPSNTRFQGTPGGNYLSTTGSSWPYDISEDIPEDRAARWRVLPEEQRAGVLTHPAWLAAHGGAFDNDPSVIFRGKWIRENLLCQDVPALSLVDVDAALDPATADLSARERITSKIDDHQECMHCHRLMNALGYPFEVYNHAGYVRVDDHGQAPSGWSMLEDMPDPSLNGEVTHARELAERLAGSRYVKRCFIRQTFRYFMGRYETAADACTLTQMEQAYDDSQGSFITMLSTLTTSDAFLYRHDPSASEDAP